MIKIHFLDGYKYIGSPPTSLLGEPYTTFRDNLTYCCFEITNWQNDQLAFLFLLYNHVNWMSRDLADHHIREIICPRIINNKTSKLYLLIKEHSIDTNGSMALEISNQKPTDHRTILKIIESKKEFYNKVRDERRKAYADIKPPKQRKKT